ncbi:MAG: transcription factor [Methanospirillaceae archaeon]|nr:transcription factor [Methanospirillaceae archaeon]
MATFKEIQNTHPAITAYLHRLVGDEGMDLIDKFPENEEHSDEDLAAMTDINLNSVRNTLYTLYEKRLAEYRRIKNNETGWLTYLWHLEGANIEPAIAQDVEVVLGKLKNRARYEEENDFYICKQCGITITFNQAMDLEFKCPSCEEPMDHFENELLLRALQNRIEVIEDSLGLV